jgi:hypothetical protein
VDKWSKPFDLSGEFNLLEINSQNFRFLNDFIFVNNKLFDILIISDIANILELIKSKNIFVYAVLCDENIICCYFFRKTCTFIEKHAEVLTCFASIQGECNKEIFVHACKVALWKIKERNSQFQYFAVENIAHNDVIIDNLKKKTTPCIQMSCAYFFYNFAHPTFTSKKVLIIC